jgi:hypothetical protein
MSVQILISIGELWDKFSILKIKQEKIKDETKRMCVDKEIHFLESNMIGCMTHKFFLQLKNINETLWDIEDRIRIKEKKKQFDEEFIQLARAVYQVNDTRAELKQKINLEFDSVICEVKDYIQYD